MSEEKFNAIGGALSKKFKAEASKMFGKPCLKINGKAFACFFDGEMVFKLEGDDHARAMKLKGSKLFDPSGKKRPMKEWVQVKATNAKEWPMLAESALSYVKG